MNKKPNPRLVDLIISWMKKELPKANFDEEYIPDMTGAKTQVNKRFTIKKGKRECFKVVFSGLAEGMEESWLKISCAPTEGILFEEATILRDRVVFGKWNSGAVVLAADPEFFEKMTLYMTRAAMVVTMGDFCPSIPEPEDKNE